MLVQGVEQNIFVFSSLISACNKSDSLCLEGIQIHGFAQKAGFLADVFVSSALLHFYGTYGHMTTALSWTSLMMDSSNNGDPQEAIEIYHQMRGAGVSCNQNSFATVIIHMGHLRMIYWVVKVLAHVIISGYGSNVSVANALIHMFGSCGDIKNADCVFHRMPERDTISWNSIISAYSQNGLCEESLRIFQEMLLVNLKPNSTALSCLVLSCSSSSVDNLRWGMGIHGLIVKLGLDPIVCVANTLITLYSESGRDLISWHSMMASSDQDGHHRNALELPVELCRNSKIRNHVTFASALAACSVPEALTGLLQNLLIGNSLVTMYGKCGMIRAAERIIHIMPERNEVTWNALIGGSSGCPSCTHRLMGFGQDDYVNDSVLTMCAKCGDFTSSSCMLNEFASKTAVSWNVLIAANAHQGNDEGALKLFVKMHHSGVEFDHFSFSGGLAGSNLATLEEGQQIHSLIIKLGFRSDLHVANASMDMYGKCGDMVDVLKIHTEPTTRSMLSWNILISGFSRHGYFKEAIETFNETGVIDEGLSYFCSMMSEFGVTQGIQHCICIIDLLGLSGRLSELENLLSAYRNHNNLELGKKAAQHLQELNPSNDAAYVLLSNVCVVSGRWEDKKPACSWVKVNKKASTFGMGAKSHPHADQIYAKLEDLKQIIRETGYISEASFSLHDTDEEQKEQNLLNHIIKIFRNLRVSGDCHSKFKLVSQAVQRTIVLRDSYRFHHFSGGKCSYGDY
ncbi:hypothetical protein MKW98_029153, partial [Papaver atlanticum]